MVQVGTHASYVAEMMKSIQEEKVRLLTPQEMIEWHGPVHYITTFAVVKPESVSTKTRVVANSAMRNARARLSLNECMWPGPNALCDLYDCLIFWRAVEVALMTDLKKAYQSIHTGEMELHLRRFLFRETPQQSWRDYAFTRATFGDISAGLILEIAKRQSGGDGPGLGPHGLPATAKLFIRGRLPHGWQCRRRGTDERGAHRRKLHGHSPQNSGARELSA